MLLTNNNKTTGRRNMIIMMITNTIGMFEIELKLWNQSSKNHFYHRDTILKAWMENFVWKWQNYFPPKSTDPTHKLLAKGKAVLLSFHPPFEWAKITIACSWSNHNMWISNNNTLPLNWKYLKLEQCFPYRSYHIMIIFTS